MTASRIDLTLAAARSGLTRLGPHETVEAALKQLRARKLTEPGDNLIVLSDMLAGGLKVDCVQLRPAK